MTTPTGARRVAMLAAAMLWLIVLVLGGASGPPTREHALVVLGWRLLGERRLSANGATSCLSCHQPTRGFTDGLAVARPGGLNTPTLWGLRERTAYGWFSPELTTLEATVLRPLADPTEQGPLREDTLARLRADPALVAAYAAAFPAAPEYVTWEQTAAALAATLRTLEPPPGAYARALAGESLALSAAARRGAALFGELGCASCHKPPAFASDSYHAIGVPADPARNQGRARVPSLRGVRYTAPYFHDGSAEHLEAVVRHYMRGGGPEASPAITPLQLTDQDVRDLVAFLEAL